VNPYQGATVLVNVSAAHNSGQPLAPALVTAVNGDGTVNVRVLYDAPPALPGFGRHSRPEHLADIPFHDTADPASANRQGQYGAFWPQSPDQHIQQELEKIMAVQDQINAAVSAVQSAVAAVQAVTADLTSAASSIQAQIAALNSQIAAGGGTPVDTTALDTAVQALTAAVGPLQAAQAAVDALEPAPAPVPAESTAPSTVNAGDDGSGA